MKRPTQSDVARLAGVSRATVSYVVNGVSGGSISTTPETRERVLRIAAELGYQPDAAAQSLRSGRIRTIGMLLPDLYNPHYWHIIRGVEEECRTHSYDLLLASTSLDPQREAEIVRSLLRGRVDGMVLSMTFANNLAHEILLLVARRCPVVCLNASVPSAVSHLDNIVPDYAGGAQQMMAYLLSLGHRRIAFVHGVKHSNHGCERLTAYQTALEEAGVPLDETLIYRCGSSAEEGHQAGLHLLRLEPRPTAILAINDMLAIGVLRAAADLGLNVPQDVSVAGFDDIAVAPYLVPSLTTLHVNSVDMGRQAVSMVFERMEQPDAPIRRLRTPTQLVVRASTCAPRET